jgi:hexosaminidase
VLRELADVVEPVKFYERPASREYTGHTPLNRLVDVVPAESEVARDFAGQVERLLADASRRQGREALRERLTAWKGLAPRVVPVLEGSPLLREVAPLAQEVSALAGAGLEALEFLERGQPAPASWWDERQGVLERARKPPHALGVSFRPAVRRLMEAARGAVASEAGP